MRVADIRSGQAVTHVGPTECTRTWTRGKRKVPKLQRLYASVDSQGIVKFG